MSIFRFLTVLSLFLFIALGSASAQDAKPYSDCAAIYIGDDMLVSEYSPQGKCTLASKTTGLLTVSTVSLSDEGSTRTLAIPFRVAIRHGETGTVYLLHQNDSVNSIKIKDVLAECQPGDDVLILTDDNRYSLPHNEISVQWPD